MNKLLLFFALISITTFSQDRNLIYEFTKGTPIKAYNLVSGYEMGEKLLIAQSGWRFKIDQEVESGLLIQFIDWGEDEPSTITAFNAQLTNNNTESKSNGTGIQLSEEPYYLITKAIFEKNTQEYKEPDPKFSFSGGVLTVPIKIRPAGDDVDENGDKVRPFDFGGDINIGLTAGLRLRLDKSKKTFLTATAGINITAVSIDENSVRGGAVTSKTNAASLTPVTGIIFEYNEFQLMGAIGWDRLAGETGENWVYQGKPWFGVGLGYKIFNTSNNTPSKNVSD